jgi:hypothetical protein
MLTQTCLKKNLPSQFRGTYEYSYANILDQNGDVGVGPSHWSYQKEEVIGPDKPYYSQPDGEKGQVEMANDEGLEIVPLGDRIVFHLSSYIESGKIPQSAYFEFSSTVGHADGHPLQSAILWQRSGLIFHLYIALIHDDFFVGAAAQVIGH